MRALQYALDEAIASLWRGRTSGMLSTATIAVALFVLGAFLIVTTNLQRLGAEWSRSAEMSVYMDDGATAENKAGIEKILEPGPTRPGLHVHLEGRSTREVQENFRRPGRRRRDRGRQPHACVL